MKLQDPPPPMIKVIIWFFSKILFLAYGQRAPQKPLIGEAIRGQLYWWVCPRRVCCFWSHCWKGNEGGSIPIWWGLLGGIGSSLIYLFMRATGMAICFLPVPMLFSLVFIKISNMSAALLLASRVGLYLSSLIYIINSPCLLVLCRVMGLWSLRE